MNLYHKKWKDDTMAVAIENRSSQVRIGYTFSSKPQHFSNVGSDVTYSIVGTSPSSSIY